MFLKLICLLYTFLPVSFYFCIFDSFSFSEFFFVSILPQCVRFCKYGRLLLCICYPVHVCVCVCVLMCPWLWLLEQL